LKKAYLLAFSSTLGTRETVKGILNRVPEVLTWRTDLPNAFYVISRADTATLARKIREAAGGKGRFIITEISNERNGWITPESWYLIREKQLKPKG
jgi:hypothetical protein